MTKVKQSGGIILLIVPAGECLEIEVKGSLHI